MCTARHILNIRLGFVAMRHIQLEQHLLFKITVWIMGNTHSAMRQDITLVCRIRLMVLKMEVTQSVLMEVIAVPLVIVFVIRPRMIMEGGVGHACTLEVV